MTHPSHREANDRVTVEISRDLEDIVPIFLGNREKDLRTIREALGYQAFDIIQTLGHRMKGDGGGYGFEKISEIGAAMEIAAKRKNHLAIEQQLVQLEDFLRRVRVVCH